MDTSKCLSGGTRLSSRVPGRPARVGAPAPPPPLSRTAPAGHGTAQSCRLHRSLCVEQTQVGCSHNTFIFVLPPSFQKIICLGPLTFLFTCFAVTFVANSLTQIITKASLCNNKIIRMEISIRFFPSLLSWGRRLGKLTV